MLLTSRQQLQRKENCSDEPTQPIYKNTKLKLKHGILDRGKEKDVRCPGLQDRGRLLHVIKSCTKLQNLERARQLYDDLKDSIPKDVYIASALINMLAKCGALLEARRILKEISTVNTVPWNALIAGYVQHAHHEEALNCFREMLFQGVTPSVVTFSCVLKACGSVRSLEIGEYIHKKAKERGLVQKDIMLGTALLDMYAKCGMLEKAQNVFEDLSERNVVSWSALIAGYAQHGFGDVALKCFKNMQDDGVSPNAVTFTCVLKACGTVGSLDLGKEIHLEVKEKGLLAKDIALGNALVDMYAKCGLLDKAKEVFEELPDHDVASWNALISGYAQHGHDIAALRCFRMMQDEGISPDAVTFICIIKVCGNTGSLGMGKEIHAKVKKQGLLERNIAVGTTLVDMYSKCGSLQKAQEVFEELRDRSIVSWNSLISGYADHGYGNAALKCFRQMQDQGIAPDAITFACILKACGKTRSPELGKVIHAQLKNQCLLERDIVLATALVDMYVKCGMLENAQEIFQQLPKRNVVIWSALIAGHVQRGSNDVALRCYRQMQDEGVYPNSVTYISVLKACGGIGSLEIGERIRSELDKQDLLRNDVVLCNMLVDMYAKCGAIEEAHRVFEKHPQQGIVSWNSLISGHAHLGDTKQVFGLISRMEVNGIFPDHISFLILFSACGHGGLLEEAEVIFYYMFNIYHLYPESEHVSCMADLFGRAGRFDSVKLILDELPDLDYLPLYSALLGACRKWENIEFGKWVFQKIVCLDVRHAASYVCMRSMYDVC